MNAFDDFLVSQEFQKKIGAFCARQGWAVARLDGGGARIDFEMPNGWRRSVYILRHERMLEFCAPSVFYIHSGELFREDLTNLLLRQNAELLFGFWCIVEPEEGQATLAIMHNVEMRLVDNEFFRSLVRYLAKTCDDLDQVIQARARSQSASILPPEV